MISWDRPYLLEVRQQQDILRGYQLEQVTRRQIKDLTTKLQRDGKTVSCPIRPDALAKSLGTGPDYLINYWSPLAGGVFRIPFEMVPSGTSLGLVEETQKRVSAWIWAQNVAFANLGHGQTAQVPTLNSDIIKSLAKQPPLTIEQRIDRALQVIGRPPAVIDRIFLGKLDQISILDPDSQQHLLLRAATECGASQQEFLWLLDEMIDAALIKPADTSKAGQTINILTIQGLNRLETGGAPLASRTAFVAMWFDPKVDDAYEKGIKPAIEKAEYKSVRIDDEEHINKIDDKIIAEIHRARFVVCDLTCGLGTDSRGQDTAITRGSVYYEAGFAHGLDKPVIWTCREDLINQAHFDVRQYNMIRWQKGKEEALRNALVNRIRAVIP